MPLSSALKFRNKNIKATYAIITDNTITCKTNTPVTPFTPITGINGVPFTDSGTGTLYYEYFVDPTGSPLPAGLTLDPTTGQITGTPTTTTVINALSFSTVCRIAVRDSRNRKAYKKSTLTFIVLDDLVAVNTTNNKVEGVVNSVTANVSLFTSITGGRPPYVYSIAAGTLPAGVTLDQPTGKLIGQATDTKRTFTDPSQTEVLPLTVPVEITVEDFYGTKVLNHAIVDFDIIDLIIATPAQATDYTVTGVIPLTINFNSFSSVVAGTPPYTYFKSTKQTDDTPDGLTLNPVTGVITGVYTGGTATKIVNGVTVPDLKEYSGTLKVSVKDSTDAISSKIANIKINAYLPFIVETLDTLPSGAPQTAYPAVKLKPITHTPFKGMYGVPPYTFRVVSYKYTDSSGAISTSTSLPSGVTLTASTGKLDTTTGLQTGTHEFILDAIDSTNTVATGFVPILFNVSDAVAANSLAAVKSYEMYVGDTSALTTGVEILSAELGIPPYTFSVAPALPAGLTMTTSATKCTLIGTATEATDKVYVFSVEDSTGTKAIVTESITLKIVDHFTSSANVTDIDAFIDDIIQPIDIFNSITGGYPPYTVTLVSGTIRPEVDIVQMGYVYFDTAQSQNITVATPQLWGNIMIEGVAPAIPILGSTHTYGYASIDSYTFSVSDSRGNVSPNKATINYNVYKRLRGTATRIPPVVTGIAEFTKVSFSPITPTGGIPPYSINITSSITDTKKKPSVKTTFPKLGLKTVQPNTIAGTPNAGYTGVLYYYMLDSVGSRTDNIPVRFNITPKISAVPYSVPIEVMFVRGYDKFEITDKTGATPVVTTPTSLKLPLFKSVTGGLVPYVYFESDSTGVVAPKSSLPTGFFIDTFGNLNGDSSIKPTVYSTSTIYCGVADSNLVLAGDPSAIKLTINDELSTTLVDNVVDNEPAVTSFNNDKSNNHVVFTKGAVFTQFSLVKGKNGSGRYSYMFDLATPSVNNVLDYFQIDGTNGKINLKPSAGGSNFTSNLDVTFGIRVTDTFTEKYKIVTNVLRLKVIDPMVMTAVSPNISFEKDSILTNQPIVNIVGGSGEYDFVSVTGPTGETALPGTLTFASSSATATAGSVTGTADAISIAKNYTIRYKDRVYGNIVSVSLRFAITSSYVVISLPKAGTTLPATSKSISLADVQTAAGMTYAQLLSTPIQIRVDITSDIYGSSTSNPALTVNLATGLNSATTVKILTKTGSLIGLGGAGGYCSNDPSVRNGKDGGPALKLNTGNTSVEIESLPGTFISGGGGGGGAGSGGWTAVQGKKMYAYVTEGGTAQRQRYVAAGGGFVWSPQGYDNTLNRRSVYIDTQYVSRVNQNSYAWIGQYGIENYSTPDPLRPSDPNYRIFYAMNNYPAKNWDFDGGTGFTPQQPTYSVVVQLGGNGGRGFGQIPTQLFSIDGDAGYVNTNKPSTIPIIESVPTLNLTRILDSEWNALLAQSPAVVKDGAMVMDTILFNDITPATPGTGVGAGAAGASPSISSQPRPYRYAAGLGGGGGGGQAGPGGDGGQASALPTEATLPAGTVYYGTAGVGGYGGSAIITTSSTDLPKLITPSLVYGDVV